MKRCKHENADHLMRGEMYEHWHLGDKGPTLHAARCEQFRCIDCGAWLSIGPSNDKPAEVQIEIRAAEIAAHVSDDGAPLVRRFDGAEHAGWIEHAFDSQKTPEQPGEWAGYLARCIVEHDNDQHNAFIDRTFAEAGAIAAEVRAPFAPGVKLK